MSGLPVVGRRGVTRNALAFFDSVLAAYGERRAADLVELMSGRPPRVDDRFKPVLRLLGDASLSKMGCKHLDTRVANRLT